MPLLLVLAACGNGEAGAGSALPADQAAWNEGMAAVDDETTLQRQRRIEAAQCAQGQTFTDWLVEVDGVMESGDEGDVEAEFSPGQEAFRVYYDEPVPADAPFFDTLADASEGDQVLVTGEFIDVREGCVVRSINAGGYRIRLTDVSSIP